MIVIVIVGIIIVNNQTHALVCPNVVLVSRQIDRKPTDYKRKSAKIEIKKKIVKINNKKHVIGSLHYQLVILEGVSSKMCAHINYQRKK